MMRSQSFAKSGLLFFAAAAAACGDGTVSQQAPGAGPESAPYPAPFPSPPQVVRLAGPVVASPVLVPVFFGDEDPVMQESLTDFLAKIGATAYWAAVTSEYGVGPAVSAAPVVLSEAAPTTIDDADIQTWLEGKLDADDPAWPAADDNTVYVLHYPEVTTITQSGQTSCKDFGGYHHSVALDTSHGQQTVAYAVVPQCAQIGRLEGIDAITVPESHELIEACTDPYPAQLDPARTPAYLYPDEAHFYYLFALSGGEVGDMCAETSTRLPELPYEVQRSWSNESIARGHDPCVPELPGEVFAAAAPVLTDDLSFTVEGQTVAMRGVEIPIGQTRTIDVDLYSDASTGGPFAVQALDYTQLAGGAPALTLSFEDSGADRSQGRNGQTLRLRITPARDGKLAIPPIWPGTSQAFILVAEVGQQKNWYLGLVRN